MKICFFLAFLELVLHRPRLKMFLQAFDLIKCIILIAHYSMCHDCAYIAMLACLYPGLKILILILERHAVVFHFVLEFHLKWLYFLLETKPEFPVLGQ